MITITVPHPTDPAYDERHGPARWSENLTDAPYVWDKAGLRIRELEGAKSGDCAIVVRDAITYILNSPEIFTGMCSYPDLVAAVASLTRLFFMLRQRPDGIVHAE